jgi:hypothetical protein
VRVTFELEPSDIQRFHEALDRAARIVRDTEELDIVAATKHSLDNLPIGGAPGYVRKRMTGVHRLVLMLEDEAWALPQPERDDVLRALVYFSDPEDLVPDDISVIGLLDDAIMLELLLRRQRHVISAWADFCAFRAALDETPGDPDGRIAHARLLGRKRDTLRLRMRRRARKAEGADVAS